MTEREDQRPPEEVKIYPTGRIRYEGQDGYSRYIQPEEVQQLIEVKERTKGQRRSDRLRPLGHQIVLEAGRRMRLELVKANYRLQRFASILGIKM